MSCAHLRSQCWGGRENHWPVSLAESLSPGFNERPCLKNKMGRDRRHSTLTSDLDMHTHRDVNIRTHMYTGIHHTDKLFQSRIKGRCGMAVPRASKHLPARHLTTEAKGRREDLAPVKLTQWHSLNWIMDKPQISPKPRGSSRFSQEDKGRACPGGKDSTW